MTGREFLNLSALEVKEWIEKQEETIVISQAYDRIYPKSDVDRKIIKMPIKVINRFRDNEIEHWQITVVNGFGRETSVCADLVGMKTFITKSVQIFQGFKLIDEYDRP